MWSQIQNFVQILILDCSWILYVESLTLLFCSMAFKGGGRDALWSDVTITKGKGEEQEQRRRITMSCLEFLLIQTPRKSKKLTGSCKRSITQILQAKRWFLFGYSFLVLQCRQIEPFVWENCNFIFQSPTYNSKAQHIEYYSFYNNLLTNWRDNPYNHLTNWRDNPKLVKCLRLFS